MPTSLPAQVDMSAVKPLEKGYYKGIVFDIPGAEVKVNGSWIAYTESNRDLIKSQNPFSLEWRFSGDLCRKMGYGK